MPGSTRNRIWITLAKRMREDVKVSVGFLKVMGQFVHTRIPLLWVNEATHFRTAFAAWAWGSVGHPSVQSTSSP